ncbi:aminoglycoside phosphotransferase (APT) family kinase protein [Streptomyces sp. LBL]|nr:aminoglycoside phosphotransferase (APT) family kinase protein [Streptomyces sp. LBL]
MPDSVDSTDSTDLVRADPGSSTRTSGPGEAAGAAESRQRARRVLEAARLAPDWRTAFTALTEAVLADVRRYRPRLPRPVDETARTLRSAHPALDEVTVPRLVHFDLWPGNILVDRPAGQRPRIGGLIDGERMFWGDPLADFVSLALLGNIERDDAFLAGYREAGGWAEFDGPARLRLALYRAYLYLIMLTETVPRALGVDHDRWLQQTVAPELVAALEEIRTLA